jgi:hypothetical protein
LQLRSVPYSLRRYASGLIGTEASYEKSELLVLNLGIIQHSAEMVLVEMDVSVVFELLLAPREDITGIFVKALSGIPNEAVFLAGCSSQWAFPVRLLQGASLPLMYVFYMLVIVAVGT